MEKYLNHYKKFGPFVWVLCAQYFVVQYVVAQFYKIHYSWRFNTISDLGNSACGLYSKKYVCSPWHTAMDASFIILGITMIIGSLLIYHLFESARMLAIGFACMAIAGLGTILVGLFPENTNSFLHSFGASLPFLIGNIGVVILGLTIKMSRAMRFYSIISGCIALISLILFLSENYILDLGQGGIERLVSYPQTIWMVVIGVYIFIRRRNNRHQSTH